VTRYPNSYDARHDRVLTVVSQLDDTDLIAMSAAWEGGDARVRERAWSKINAKLRHDPRSKMLDEARDWLSSWASRAQISWRGGIAGASVIIPGGIDVASLRREVFPAALDAVAAMLVDEVIDDDERDELLGPLRLVSEPAG
jgi:hypothetical protein